MSQQTQIECQPPLQDSPEKNKYQDQLSAVLNMSLTPDNIDNYADDALDQLVGIVDKVVSDYQTSHPDEPSVSEDLKIVEDKAFSHYGLTGLDNILDNVVRLSDNLSHIDALIANAIASPTVILGTDPSKGRMPIEAGDGSFVEKKLIPRLKTILFVLQEDFNFDIDDTEKVKLTPGVMQTGMMRKETYYSVEIRDLNKTVIVCDEEGNITFVLNDAYLRENGISSEDINGLYKTDLTDLIESDSNVGTRLPYSKFFVDRLNAALSNYNGLTDKGSDYDEDSTAMERTYLYPKAPEGYLTRQALADQLGVSSQTVIRAITTLVDALGAVDKYRFGSNTTYGYSPYHVDIISIYLAEKGSLTDHAPEGYMSTQGIANHIGLDRSTIVRATRTLVDALGKVDKYKFGPNTTQGYSPEQIDTIVSFLGAGGVLADQPPEGYLSARGIASLLRTSHKTVVKAINTLGYGLDRVEKYRFGSKTTQGYSPDQIEMIDKNIGPRRKSKIGGAALSSSNDI
jgi:hypothetical protein